MKKLLKIFFILSIMLTFFMNLSVFAANEEATDTSALASVAAASSSSTSSDSSTSTSTRVSSVKSVNDGELSISDILNILLIATGVVIILLAIAIFIKLK